MKQSRPNGLETLSRPRNRYLPDGKGDFPLRETAVREDEQRARGLRLRKAIAPDALVAQLLDKLTRHSRRIRRTLASVRNMHKLRRNLVGELVRLIVEGGETARCFTLMPGDLKVPAAKLLTADPKRMIEQLRGALRRATAELEANSAGFTADGWLLVCVEAEHNREHDYFDFHFHGVADGGMLAVVEALRKQRRFATPPKGSGQAIPVQIKREAPTSVPDALSYLLKSWYISRDRRFGLRCLRIPEPHHTTWLQWMDRRRLDDLVLLVGLRVVGGQLRLGHRNNG